MDKEEKKALRRWKRRERREIRRQRKLQRYKKIRKSPIIQNVRMLRIISLNAILYLFDDVKISWIKVLRQSYVDYKEIKKMEG